MKSYTESVALLNSLSKVPSTDTTNTALLTQLWNDSIRTVCNIRGGRWKFLESTTSVSTVADQQGYYIPARVRKIINLYITVGTIKYLPTPVFNPEEWNLILATNMDSSDVPMYYYVQDNQVLIYPSPATSSNTITIRGRRMINDLNVADASVTVTAIANAGTAVTVSSGALASMAGKFLRITASATGAADKGDGYWYEIASATPTATITLLTPYAGTTLSGASAAATVGQMTPLPDAYDMAPIYRAIALYQQINDPLHPASYQTWWRLYDGGQEAGLSSMPGGIVAQMLENEGDGGVEGAYISPNGLGNLDPNNPPRYPLSGF